MKHTVHVFAVVRVKCEGVEADNHENAVEKARDCFADLYNLFDTKNLKHIPDGITDVKFGEEFSYFLVDEDGDTEFERTTWHDIK